ncbi:MAG: energy transducer TonB [Gemmatimonadota bacterium]
MKRACRRAGALGALLVCACSGRRETPEERPPEGQNDVPVAVNGESPFQYPSNLYDEGVEGEVRLRLFVDALGHVHPESTRVAESSGTPALDSAAIAGAALLRFAPAHRNGAPVGVAFFQPVIFRRGATSGAPPIQ